jgi:heme exporter protein D
MHERRRPFWEPAANFYVFAVATSAAFFFISWGLLHDSGEDTPWVPAGIGASVLLAGAVVVREVALRRGRRRRVRSQQAEGARLQAANLRAMASGSREPAKLTIEQNAALVGEIRQKSEAAKLLNRFSASHREVFEMCVEYLALNEHELKTVNPNSPRLAPLLRGRSSIAELQRYHLLKWAEIETRNLTADAQNRAEAADRIEAARTALGVLQNALHFYPAERSLLESHSVVTELIVSIKVREWMDQAERAAFKGDYAAARSCYEDALFELTSGPIENPAREEAARRITAEIEHLDGLAAARSGELRNNRND